MTINGEVIKFQKWGRFMLLLHLGTSKYIGNKHLLGNTYKYGTLGDIERDITHNHGPVRWLRHRLKDLVLDPDLSSVFVKHPTLEGFWSIDEKELLKKLDEEKFFKLCEHYILKYKTLLGA